MTCSASKCRSSTERRPARLEEIGLPCHGTFLAQIAAGDLDVAVLGQLPAAQLSLDDKLRIRTGLTDDGNTLIDRALAGDPPLLAINPLKTESERSEQKGFANLVRGTFGMFRNTTAHEARIHWPIGKVTPKTCCLWFLSSTGGSMPPTCRRVCDRE